MDTPFALLQGRPLLWGSFEIRTPVLWRQMLRQIGGQDLKLLSDKKQNEVIPLYRLYSNDVQFLISCTTRSPM